jgi:YfiH family protein
MVSNGVWTFDSREQVYRVVALEQFDWLDHWFGTRNSTLDFQGRNLATLHQIHSDIAIAADGQAGRIGDGDALLTMTPGQLVAVRTADCLPILIADERRHAVAAVHAGWRGTVLGVAAQAVRELGRLFASQPEDLHAAIGPGIGACCYQVGPEVAAEFQPLFPERDLSGRTTIDLAEANRRRLAAAGLRDDRIYLGAPCTFCMKGEFFSYRREREQAGRMLSGIGVRAANHSPSSLPKASG